LLSGLVIVGFGTSAPELVVTVDAALTGRPDIAIGNVVGSNIGNVLLILGLCAVITPLAVRPLALRRDAVTVVLAGLLFLVLVGGSALARPDAAVLLLALLVYLVWAYWTERSGLAPAARLHQAEANELTALPGKTLWIVAAIGLGLGLLIVGSRVLLLGAVGLAEAFGVPEAVIGLTLVAVGTSLPRAIDFNHCRLAPACRCGHRQYSGQQYLQPARHSRDLGPAAAAAGAGTDPPVRSVGDGRRFAGSAAVPLHRPPLEPPGRQPALAGLCRLPGLELYGFWRLTEQITEVVRIDCATTPQGKTER
jgi:hypothetical protein